MKDERTSGRKSRASSATCSSPSLPLLCSSDQTSSLADECASVQSILEPELSSIALQRESEEMKKVKVGGENEMRSL